MPKQLNQLAKVIEGTMLSSDSFFKLIGRIMKLLADNFFYNELSVEGYLKSYKVIMTLLHSNKFLIYFLN